MPKTRPSKAPWDARAAEILAGRARVDAGDLIDLIHEVNPTGRGRSAEETAARYAIKSRLQSLLVTRFGSDLEVTPDPDDPGVASLRHRYKRHDACHAVIASLDDDARSWVQQQIDVAAGPESEAAAESRAAPSSESPPGDVEELGARELLAAGEEALASYDYERAGQCFSRAVAASGGGVEAALALLSFIVDAMAADEDALAIEGRLPAATLADPRIALLLGLAAARTGDEARALGHVARAHDPRVAEVRALLARRALAGGDTEGAARHARAAEAADPSHPELRPLEDAIASARAAERAPREESLSALVAAGRDAEALAEAEAILARWPESEPARRAVRQIEERRREDAGRRHLAEGEEALARGETAIALERLHRALGSPLSAPDRQRALGRVREAESLARERATRARAEEVVALLAEADRARALAAYVELESEGRAAVRARVSLPALGWLDAIPAARPGGRVRAAVEAVLALARASDLAEKDVAAAAALLVGHERILDDLPLFEAITDRARAAAAAGRAHRAASELHEAGVALAGGHLERARALLDRVDLRALPEDARAGVATLEAGIAAAEERRREERRFDQLRAAGAFRAARAAALALAERDAGAERARWTAEAEEIAARARTRFALRVEDLSDGGPELLQNPGFLRLTREEAAWVADGGRELLLCNTANAWGFFRVIDIETGRVTRGGRFACDAPLAYPRSSLHAEGVTIIGSSGLLEIDVAAGEVVQRFERNWNRDRGPIFGDGLKPDGTRLLWGNYGTDDDTVKIVDLDGGPAAKTFVEAGGPWPLVGSQPVRVVTHKNWYDEANDKRAHTIVVHEPGGAPIGRFETRREPSAVVAHPSGAGVVAFCDEYSGNHESRVSLLEISERFELVAAPLIEAESGFWPDPQAQIALARDAGLVFVVFLKPRARHATLVALRSVGPGLPLVEHYRAEVPPRITLAHDRSARRAFAVVDHPGGLSITQLGLTPPVDLPESGPCYRRVEAFENVNWCSFSGNSEAINLYVAIRQIAPADRPAAIAAREEQAAGDPAKLMVLYFALLNGEWLEPAARVLARAEASFPADPVVRVAPFAMLVAERRYAELVPALLDARDRFAEPFVQHYHHLLATAHARQGEVDEALRHLTLAESITTTYSCVNRLQHLRSALDSLPGGADDLGFDRPAAAQLVAVLRAADRHLGEGDPAAAIAVLERPLTWDLLEVHSLGRLAAAHLALPAKSAAARFRKALALATFVECLDTSMGGSRREGLAPGLAWPEARIEALRDEAIAWLEADQGVTRAPVWTED